jgi:hypothetical protein
MMIPKRRAAGWNPGMPSGSPGGGTGVPGVQSQYPGGGNATHSQVEGQSMGAKM